MAPAGTFHLKAHQPGFTLTELVVTLAIGALMATLAVPPLADMVRANQIQSASAEFQTALAMARSEAIKRGTNARVTMVPNASPTNGKDCRWQYGLTVYYSNKVPTSTCPPPRPNEATLLMKTAAIHTNVAVQDNLPNAINYNGMGRSVTQSGALLGGKFEFKKLHAGDPKAAVQTADPDLRCVIISMTGRVRSERIPAGDYNGSCITAEGGER